MSVHLTSFGLFLSRSLSPFLFRTCRLLLPLSFSAILLFPSSLSLSIYIYIYLFLSLSLALLCLRFYNFVPFFPAPSPTIRLSAALSFCILSFILAFFLLLFVLSVLLALPTLFFLIECFGTGTGTGLFLDPGSAWTMHMAEASFMGTVSTGSNYVVPRIWWLWLFVHTFLSPPTYEDKPIQGRILCFGRQRIE